MGIGFLGLTTDQWFHMGISIVIILFTVIFGRWTVRLLVEKPLKKLTRGQIQYLMIFWLMLPSLNGALGMERGDFIMLCGKTD